MVEDILKDIDRRSGGAYGKSAIIKKKFEDDNFLFLEWEARKLRELLIGTDMCNVYETHFRERSCPDFLYEEFGEFLPTKVNPDMIPSIKAHLVREATASNDERLLEILGTGALEKTKRSNSSKQTVQLKQNVRSGKPLEVGQFRSLIQNLELSNFENRVAFSVFGVYGRINITDEDRKLAALWLGKTPQPPPDPKLAKMLSARCAEKVGKRFYESLGHRVTDVAIQQVQGGGSDWKRYDLKVDDKAVDVKNARPPVNTNRTYVDHTVPSFKETRNGKDVTILGVYSPYLQLKYLNSPEHLPGSKSESRILVLGETSLKAVNELKARFVSGELSDIEIKQAFVPPWLFEFPAKLYQRSSEKVEMLRELKQDDIPDLARANTMVQHPVSLYLAHGLEIPESWRSELKEHQLSFVDQLDVGKAPLNLPTIYLTVLTHFLQQIREGSPGYKPSDYNQLLFSDDWAKLGNRDANQYPLGIYDPLETVWTLCDTLSTLWRHKEQVELKKFKAFKLRGLGLLQGKYDGDKRQTILAYCGGFIEEKGKCGNAPLILGKHLPCPVCRFLICEKCGFCSKDCTRNANVP